MRKDAVVVYLDVVAGIWLEDSRNNRALTSLKQE